MYLLCGSFWQVPLPAPNLKDFRMLVFAKEEDNATMVERSIETPMDDVRGKKMQPGTIHGVQKGVGSPSPEICEEKVLHIRQQLGEGKYDFDKRLNIIFDKLLDELFGQDRKTRSLTGT
jgi:hypothetical protein